MINEQLLTRDAFLKLTKEQAWNYYERLANRSLKLENKKQVSNKQLKNKEEIIRSIKANREQRRLRDQANGSLAHPETNPATTEAIEYWWEIKSKNPSELVGAKNLGKFQNEVSELSKREPKTISGEMPEEDRGWHLSLNTYRKINTAAIKAWEHQCAVEDKALFIKVTKHYKNHPKVRYVG